MSKLSMYDYGRESKESYIKIGSVCNQETKKVKVSILNTNPFHNIINRVETITCCTPFGHVIISVWNNPRTGPIH